VNFVSAAAFFGSVKAMSGRLAPFNGYGLVGMVYIEARELANNSLT